MIPSSSLFDQSTITTMLEHDPMVLSYRSFFSLLDWSLVDAWQSQRSSRGRPLIHPTSAYLKAFLLRLREGLIYSTQLRSFLLKHPLLIIDFGFQLVLDAHAPYGFDAEKTLPSRFWFGQKLHDLDQTLLQRLLHGTVTAFQAEIPGLGETVAFDVKHIYAWVKENNERVYVSERYDKTKRLAGDPHCRLGVKKSSNREKASTPSAPTSPTPSPSPKSSPSAPRTPATTEKSEPKKEKKSSSGAMAPELLLPPRQTMAMWFLPNTLSPLTKRM